AELEPHIKGLQAAKTPQATGMLHLLEGRFYMRDGRLDKARQHLEQAAREPAVAGMVAGPLVEVYLALGRPDRALPGMRQLEQVLSKSPGDLSPAELAWVTEFRPNAEELTAQQVMTNLGAAQLRVRRHLQQQRPLEEKGVLEGLVGEYEKEVQRLLKRLKPGTVPYRIAHQALGVYHLSLGRLDKAREGVTLLQKEAPDSVATLRLELNVLIQEMRSKLKETASLKAKLTEVVDSRMQSFLREHPKNREAQLLWATWLTRSER